MKPIWNKAKKELSKMLRTSTAYGIPNIIQRRRLFNKFFWLFFLLTSSVFSFYYTYIGVVEYYKYEVVTEIKNEYDQPSEFPTITICSLRLYYFDDKNFSDIIKYASFSYDYSLGEEEYFYENFELLNTSIGVCLRFNSGSNSKSEQIQIKNSTFGGQFDSFALAIESPDGLAVWIHNKTSPPMITVGSGDGDDPINVLPGFQTYLAIEKTVDEKLGEPYNECLDDITTFKKNKTIINTMLNNKKFYSQIKCINLCFDLKYIEGNPCNCSNTTLGNVWPDCWVEKEEATLDSCTFNAKKDFYNRNLKQYCADFCPLECYTISYAININTFKSLHFNDTDITSIKVFYRNLKYIYISQQPKMLLFDALSNVGGTLGLFIGLSFVTIFEIIEIFLELILLFFKVCFRVKTFRL